MIPPVTLFGPHIRAEVTIINGVAQQVEVFHPTKLGSIIVPADWACNVTDPRGKIIADVSASLYGAVVVAIP